MPVLPAVLFDVDGTLVDSNYVHVHAWQRAFRDADVPVDAWRIHRGIGMDGATLLQELAGDASDDQRARAKELHSSYYTEMAPLLRLLPGAKALLATVADRGLQVVLATSAPEDELAVLRKILDSEDIVSVVTSSEDVDTAKPDPSIVQVALDKAGVTADRAVFLGDSVWDATAATRVSVPMIGVRSGGVGADELQNAGAAMVFDDPADLLAQLDATPIAALQ